VSIRLSAWVALFPLLCLPMTGHSDTATSTPASAQRSAQRIVSLSLCTDQLLLMLVPPERIAALSYLAPDRNYSYLWKRAQGLALHHGLVEEILPLQPDLIVDNRYTTGNTQNLLKQLGHPVRIFDSPTTIAGVEQVTRAMGEAVGEQAKAEEIISTLHQDIALAQQRVAALPLQRAVSYGPNGYTAGLHTLKQEAFRIAGYTNIGAELGINDYGNLSVEQLVASKPDAIVFDEISSNQNSLAQNQVNHPVLQQLFASHRIKQHLIPTRYWLCPDASVAKAILTLAEQRQCAHC